MFHAAIHKAEHTAVDKLNYLTGEAMEAVAGYQLTNENHTIMIDGPKKREKTTLLDVSICK